VPDNLADPLRAVSPVLELVCQRCVRELAMAHTTVALATADGLWSPAYATTPTAAALEAQAFTLGEGPCYDALHGHRPVLVADLDERRDGDRWPLWLPGARDAGIRSVAAFPIQSGAIAAGVLTMYSAAAGALRGERLALALRLADTALLGVLDVLAGLDTAGADPAELAAVLRADVHQAAGMIMGQAGIPIAEALAQLRARAFQTGRPVAELAIDVLTGRVRFALDADSAE
jgi:hypothetical protein